MTVVCAWCGVTLKRGDGREVSHGICGACSKAVESRFVANWPRPIARPRRRRRVVFPTLPLPGFGPEALQAAPAGR